MKKLLLFTPLILLFAVVFFLVLQLKNPDSIAPSEDWRGKPLPTFRLPHLLDEKTIISNHSLPREPYILNVWASWCSWCIKEFPMLKQMQQQGIRIVGLTYADRPNDARQALNQWGNPFELIINDYQHAQLITALNIHSAPATYLVDQNGIIRYQQKGYNPNLAMDFLERLTALK
ncbi:cytochrome c biogenesis protein CcmG/thiol:disulfide interchange protein DsbE [Nicoletella semolina]|uniref:Cytochrome c biogenesis protein CcmG/thiol:disulfide interchange protein DsbE n=1 Tax=Nicoletella semolina TaxID=271160 RepID=A0A4R2N8N3_9PAST|nr:redoxin family protein [Nicoletella semolina]MDH2924525.1 dihydroneopterin aldolase [Nicoletella semolina]TCP17347.1 cytochrome c biogenesis protein CcmG/thiol:disulfide interchange protein DsbE [Nicoletella semolina]